MLSEDKPTSITATPRATAALEGLARAHGPLAVFQSGGCCDGSLPLCLLADELTPAPDDLLLGVVAGAPFYMNAEQFHRWGDPEFLLDIADGAPEGFSLGPPGAHFITRAPSRQARAAKHQTL